MDKESVNSGPSIEHCKLLHTLTSGRTQNMHAVLYEVACDQLRAPRLKWSIVHSCFWQEQRIDVLVNLGMLWCHAWRPGSYLDCLYWEAPVIEHMMQVLAFQKCCVLQHPRMFARGKSESHAVLLTGMIYENVVYEYWCLPVWPSDSIQPKPGM